MPPEKPRRIKRTHSGCKSCRRRGKKCDETKPTCRACLRLWLECSYGVEYTFKNAAAEPPNSLCMDRTLSTAANFETAYLAHFTTHVRPILPADPACFSQKTLLAPSLKSAIICISASNLSMLNVTVQTRCLPSDPRRSVSSPLVNRVHHTQARKYHDQALSQCTGSDDEVPAILLAYTLLAYYHHASTDHRLFRLAVWESIRFVARNQTTLSSSPEGWSALQLWYRLCISHRLGKPPSLPLEGENDCRIGPARDVDGFEDLYLNCILNMTTDDLVYDILIKTIEIRKRLVVFRCVDGLQRQSGTYAEKKSIGILAHDLLDKLTGHQESNSENIKPRTCFIQSPHLQSLLDIQGERLKVWKSRLSEDQQPFKEQPTYPTHRDAMNSLYALLIEMMVSENSNSPILLIYVNQIIRILSSLDLDISSKADVYTFSLTEVLLQLVQIYQSEDLFSYILDVIWPEMERNGRGYEHSHYPTHLAKRVIALLAGCHAMGKRVCYAVPASDENTSKLQLLDVQREIGVVCAGWDTESGKYFVERMPL